LSNEEKTSNTGAPYKFDQKLIPLTCHANVRFPNKDAYTGYYKEGKKCGHGVYLYFENGDKYDGNWKDDRKHGLGKMEYKGKGREGEYHGYWEHDRRHGEGVFVYKNGDIYSGWWRFGDKEG
jgi:radial spoke head protein 1